MPRDFCDITVVLDRSGSMSVIQSATVEGLNAFIEDQKKVPGDGCWSLVQFDDPATAKGANEPFPQVVFSARPQSEMRPISSDEFLPRGGTALVDAVVRTIDETGKRLAAMPDGARPDKVLFVIMTDGQENSSRQFTKAQLNERISHQRSKYNWQFIFLGANQDAIAEAQEYGIPTSSALTFDHTDIGTQTAYRAASAGIRAWRVEGNPTAAPMVSCSEPDDPKIKVNVDVTVPGASP